MVRAKIDMKKQLVHKKRKLKLKQAEKSQRELRKLILVSMKKRKNHELLKNKRN